MTLQDFALSQNFVTCLLLLESVLFRYVVWNATWYTKYYVKKEEYDDAAKHYLIRKNMGLNEEQFAVRYSYFSSMGKFVAFLLRFSIDRVWKKNLLITPTTQLFAFEDLPSNPCELRDPPDLKKYSRTPFYSNSVRTSAPISQKTNFGTAQAIALGRHKRKKK